MKLYISSADFMTRNTLRRVEVAAPVYDTHVRTRIMHIFDILTKDNVKARVISIILFCRHSGATRSLLVFSARVFVDRALNTIRASEPISLLAVIRHRSV